MNKEGRPSKYKEEYNLIVLDMFKEGCSISEIALDLDISRQTIYYWAENIPEFSYTLKKGLEYSQGWWEKQGRTALYSNNDPMSSKINPAMWFMNMKNRFREDWKDKHEVEVATESNKTEYEVRKSLYE